MASISKIANLLDVTDMKAFESFTRKMKLGRGVNPFIDNLTHIKGETPISNGNGYPRYLYHFTTRENATSIFQSGKLEARTYELFKGGVFSVDLCNILSSYNAGGITKLLKHAQKDSDSLTLLRIPVNKLNKSLLKLRDISRVTLEIPAEGGIVINKIMKKYNCKSHDELLELAKKDNSIYEELMCKLEPYFGCSIGRNAGKFKLFRGKKQPIEFMYPQSISADCIEEVGTVNVKALEKSTEYDSSKPNRSILGALLKGHPEEKALVRVDS